MGRDNWRCYKLNELGFVGRGKSKHRPRNDPRLYGGIYPFIQTADIKNAVLYARDFSQTYNDAGLAQSKIWDEGTLCITIAANIAETAILGIRACFPDSVVGFIADPQKSDTRFVKYYIDTLKYQMQSISQGTTQDNLSLEKLLSFEILTPPLPTQRKIAAILSAYDDLIENNTRRIRILEAMAQAIYREWFVNFRYPGHEGVRLVESPLGLIPEGWEVKSFSHLADYVNGYPFKPEDWKQEGVPIIKIVELKNGVTQNTPRSEGKGIPVKYFVKSGYVLFSWSASLDVYIWPWEDGILNQHIFHVVPFPEYSNNLLYFLLNQHIQEFRNLSLGATMQHIKRSALDYIMTAVPPIHLRSLFEKIIGPIISLTITLHQQNTYLRQQRDMLLPRLISGELDVEALEIPTL